MLLKRMKTFIGNPEILFANHVPDSNPTAPASPNHHKYKMWALCHVLCVELRFRGHRTILEHLGMSD